MSYAALYQGANPIIHLAAGSEGGFAWVRPAWPSLGDLTATDNTFKGVYGVENSDSNFVSLIVSTDYSTPYATYTVDWGDGVIDIDIDSNVQVNHTYDYATIAASVVGEYKPVIVTITTSGDNIIGFDFGVVHPLNNSPTSRINWLDIAINASLMTYLIIGQSTLVFSALEQVKIYSNTFTSTSNMFVNCYSLQSVPLFDTSGVTDMSFMFYNCRSLQILPLLNAATVTNMSYMFSGCYSLQSLPLFNTLSVTNMFAMFEKCYSLRSVPLFDTSAVTNMSYMFYSCSSLISVPLLDKSSVTDDTAMFLDCFCLTII